MSSQPISPYVTPDPLKVEALCVRTLFERARIGTMLAPLGTLFLCWIEQDVVVPALLFTWMIINTLPDAVTLVLALRFARRPPAEGEMRRWHDRQLGLRVLQGVAWGSMGWFFHIEGPTSFTNDLIVLVVLVAVIATSVVNMAPSFRTLAVFTISALLTPFALYLWVGDARHIEFAIGILILLGVILKFGWDAHRQFVEGIRQVVLNQAISEKLEQTMEAVRVANADLKQRNQQLAETLQQLHIIAIHDELTDAFNRHFIVAQLERQIEMFERYGNICSLVMLDIDLFKQVNDRYGHAVGDDVLIAFSQRIESLLRQGDFIGRYGGEEFILVLPMTDMDAALQLAQRIRSALSVLPLIKHPVELIVTASFGVAQLRAGEHLDAWLLRADQALYRAKARGRNRVEAEV